MKNTEYTNTQLPQGETETLNPSVSEVALIVADSVFSLIRLVKTEVVIGACQIPRLLTLWIVQIQLLLLFWLSLSAGVGWLMASQLTSAVAGLGSFLVMQVAGLLVVRHGFKTVLKSMSLPASREEFRRFISLFQGLDSQVNDMKDGKTEAEQQDESY